MDYRKKPSLNDVNHQQAYSELLHPVSSTQSIVRYSQAPEEINSYFHGEYLAVLIAGL